MEVYGEQGYYSREEDNDSITSRDRYTDRQTDWYPDSYTDNSSLMKSKYIYSSTKV